MARWQQFIINTVELNKDRYIIRDTIEHEELSYFETLTGAQEEMALRVGDDKKEGIYTEEYYEIYDSENQEIIEISE